MPRPYPAGLLEAVDLIKGISEVENIADGIFEAEQFPNAGNGKAGFLLLSISSRLFSMPGSYKAKDFKARQCMMRDRQGGAVGSVFGRVLRYGLSRENRLWSVLEGSFLRRKELCPGILIWGDMGGAVGLAKKGRLLIMPAFWQEMKMSVVTSRR